jgi:hypothetical protein
VTAGQWPGAEVDAQLFEAPVGVVVGDAHVRKVDSPGLTVEVQNHLFEAASLGYNMLDVLDRNVALGELLVRLGNERLERLYAPDAPAQWVVELGFAGERLDQRIRLSRHQTVEVRNVSYELVPPLLLQSHARRCGE